MTTKATISKEPFLGEDGNVHFQLNNDLDIRIKEVTVGERYPDILVKDVIPAERYAITFSSKSPGFPANDSIGFIGNHIQFMHSLSWIYRPPTEGQANNLWDKILQLFDK